MIEFFNCRDEGGEKVEDASHQVGRIQSFKCFQCRDECLAHRNWYALVDGIIQAGGQCVVVEGAGGMVGGNTFDVEF